MPACPSHCRFTKHIEKEGTSSAKLVLRLKYEHMERWWIMHELKARDEERQAREDAKAQAEGKTTAEKRPEACLVS